MQCTMITHQQMNTTLRALVSTWVLFTLTALPLPAEEPYVQWAIPGGGPLSFCEGSSPPLFDGISISASAVMLAKLTERPRLDIGRSVGGVQLSWPSKATNYVVEAATSLSASSWDTDTNAPTVIGRNRCLQLPATGNAKFFRLRKP